MGMMMMRPVAALMTVEDEGEVVFILWLSADEAEEPVDEQSQQNPHGIEYNRCFKDVEYRSPQLAERCFVFNYGIDVEQSGYHKADDKREQFGSETTGGNIEVGHLLNEK